MNISRQAFYKYRNKVIKAKLEEEVIVELVNQVRRSLPRLGGRKLYHLLEDDLSKLPVKIGRDKFFAILRRNGLLVEPLRQYVKTTNSHHIFRIYTNLVKELTVDQPNKVFVSDITYIRLAEGFCYLFLVTDLCSRKIVGFDLSMSLATEGAIAAMKMALKQVAETKELIHHSDRGIQYCSGEYVELLQSKKIKLSMGETGNPYDNAVAERVNGILKTEFLLNATFTDYKTALKATREAISSYNNLRPHMSLEYMTPAQRYAA